MILPCQHPACRALAYIRAAMEYMIRVNMRRPIGAEE